MTEGRVPPIEAAAGPAVVAGPDQLARGSLSTWDAIAISVSVLAPGMAMLLNVPGVALVAGGSTPLSFLLGGIGVLALAFVVIGFTRRMASAGTRTLTCRGASARRAASSPAGCTPSGCRLLCP